MTGSILNALKGGSGEYELNRVVGAIGSISFIVSTNIFVGWDVMVKGRGFDVVAYCLAFPSGLAAVLAAIAGAVKWKDRGVAEARAIEQSTATAAAGVTP